MRSYLKYSFKEYLSNSILSKMKLYLPLLGVFLMGCSITRHDLQTIDTLPIYGEQGIGTEPINEIEASDTIIVFTKRRSKVQNVTKIVYKSRLAWTVGVPYKTRTIYRKRIRRRTYLSQINHYTFLTGSNSKSVTNNHSRDELSSKPYGYTPSTGATIHTGPRGGRYYINSNGNKTYLKKGASSPYHGSSRKSSSKSYRSSSSSSSSRRSSSGSYRRSSSGSSYRRR
jgi:hypothetical protein